jgi:hypothetical protein
MNLADATWPIDREAVRRPRGILRSSVSAGICPAERGNAWRPEGG